MEKIFIFSDASVSNQKNIGIGVYLILTKKELSDYESKEINELLNIIKEKVNYVQLNTNKSTYMELCTVNKALENNEDKEIIIFTDCNKIKKILRDKKNILVIKIKGHERKYNRINIEDKIFVCVDRLSRKRLRNLKI